MTARIAWALAIVTAVLLAADIATTSVYESLTSDHAIAIHGLPFIEAAVIGCAVMGALILSRYPRHPIGSLLLASGVASAISLLTEAYSVWVIDHGGPGSRGLGGVCAWISQLFGGQLSIALIAVLFLVAPDGHLLSPRWRYLAWTSAIGTATCSAALFTQRPTTFDTVREDPDPGLLAATLFSIGFVLISIGLVGSLVAMLLRLRASRGEQRRQVGLVAAAALLLVVGVLVLFVMEAVNGGEQTLASSGPLFVSYATMPLLLAIAVLRYRLYEIDVIINRAVILTVGTAFAGVGYVALVVGIGAAVNARTSGFWLSLGVTAVVALAFQPLRRGVVRLANRLAYGARAVPYLTLSDFSRRLAQTPEAPALLPAVAEATGRAVAAAESVVTLDLPGNNVTNAAWTDHSSPAGDLGERHEILIRSHGDVVGTIQVTPRPGRRFRPADLTLLQDLADQTSQSFHNLATEGRLAEQVAALDRTTQQLADSRRRIIDADDAARVRLEAAIAREVLPQLTALPERVAAVREMGGGPVASTELDRLVHEVNDTLERLREITRGVFPTQLARAGLGPALRSLLGRQGLDGCLTLDRSVDGRRFTSRVEAAVFFGCAELLRGPARPSHVGLRVDGDDLLLRATDVDLTQVDLQAILDRVEAVGGVVGRDRSRELTLVIPVGAQIRTPVGAASPRPL